MRMPSPGQMMDNYIEGLKRPLVSRSRVEDVDVQKARQLMVERKTPSELASLAHPFDIPLPKFRSANRSKSRDAKKAAEER